MIQHVPDLSIAERCDLAARLGSAGRQHIADLVLAQMTGDWQPHQMAGYLAAIEGILQAKYQPVRLDDLSMDSICFFYMHGETAEEFIRLSLGQPVERKE